ILRHVRTIEVGGTRVDRVYHVGDRRRGTDLVLSGWTHASDGTRCTRGCSLRRKGDQVLVVGLSERVAHLVGELGARLVVVHCLFKVGDKDRADEHVIDVDDLLTVRDVLTEDDVTRSVILHRRLADGRELRGRTALDGALADAALELSLRVEDLQDFAAEYLEKEIIGMGRTGNDTGVSG